MKPSLFKIIFNLIIMISILMIIITFATCKTNSGTPNYPITEEDAASVISNAVLPQYGGLLAHLNDGISLGQKPVCGTAKDSLIIWASQSTSSPITYKTSLQWHYQINCATNALSGTYSGSISYSGSRFSADNTCNGILTCTPQTSSAYKISLTLNIAGTDAKKEVGANKLTTNIDVQSSEIMVDKVSGQVISGKMQVNIHISYYTYTGTFKFLGNGQATLVLNSGTVYNLSL